MTPGDPTPPGEQWPMVCGDPPACHPPKVKICGINESLAFDTAVEAGADWVGFVFFPPSPRSISPEFAGRLSRRASGGPLRVGLFVEPSDAAIAAVLDAVTLDILQIYGLNDRLGAIRARFGLPVWCPVGVASAADLPVEASGADMLLMEAKPPAEATRPGGNASCFDWQLLRGWSAPAPWMLAGGLTAENVSAAISLAGAVAVDVSSGVERTRGVKDSELIRAFILAAKGCSPAAV